VKEKLYGGQSGADQVRDASFIMAEVADGMRCSMSPVMLCVGHCKKQKQATFHVMSSGTENIRNWYSYSEECHVAEVFAQHKHAA